ncbi:MAG: hypothetical protein K5770_01355 [Lachnospiraceae bacterium]|nr:hypothetical protein [Lachnospiraceae bacterium]
MYEVKQLVNELKEFDESITVVGPSGGIKKLRVYAYGSIIAKIPTTHGDGCNGLNAGIDLCNPDYFKYICKEIEYNTTDHQVCTYSPDLTALMPADRELKKGEDNLTTGASRLKDMAQSGSRERTRLFINRSEREDYLRLVLCAAKNKMTRVDTSGKEGGNDRSERAIQTEIVREFMKKHNDWCVVDMEYMPEYISGPGRKPDLIVYDRELNQFGIIELKYDNKSCANLGDHYEQFLRIQTEHTDKFVPEIKRRCGILANNSDLISDQMKDQIADADENNIWFAFLFVGGEKYGAGNEKGIVDSINEYLLCKDKEIREKTCLIQYVPYDEENEKKYLEQICLKKNEMQVLGSWL